MRIIEGLLPKYPIMFVSFENKIVITSQSVCFMVHCEPFSISVFHVFNKEWACFITSLLKFGAEKGEAWSRYPFYHVNCTQSTLFH